MRIIIRIVEGFFFFLVFFFGFGLKQKKSSCTKKGGKKKKGIINGLCNTGTTSLCEREKYKEGMKKTVFFSLKKKMKEDKNGKE